jgi:hypothetical protein
MKKMKRNFYKPGLAVFAVCIVLFATPFVLAKCTKGKVPEIPQSPELRAFTGSSVYKGFIGKKHVIGKVDIDAARIVRFDNSAALVHIPVMRHTNIEGAIIGLPLGRTGQYELLYQDNRAALSGTGNIYLYTSSNELFAKINLKNGAISSVVPAELSARSQGQNPMARIDCGFFCRLNKCYTQVKAQFPGEAICDLLDIFFGVCSSATVASCLIKMAIN